jgi:hypothetical protein
VVAALPPERLHAADAAGAATERFLGARLTRVTL